LVPELGMHEKCPTFGGTFDNMRADLDVLLR
jgi:hypothetical protein